MKKNNKVQNIIGHIASLCSIASFFEIFSVNVARRTPVLKKTLRGKREGV
jgi:hypothetical protein